MSIWDRVEGSVEFDCTDVEIGVFQKAQDRARELTRLINCIDSNEEEKNKHWEELLGYPLPEGTVIRTPFYCDLGNYISLGENVSINMNCVFIDGGTIEICDNTMIGPGVQIITAEHPKSKEKRRTRTNVYKNVYIGEDAWIGAGAIILPGVTVGENSIVGAGSVVTRDIPPNCVAVGVPAKVIGSASIESKKDDSPGPSMHRGCYTISAADRLKLAQQKKE